MGLTPADVEACVQVGHTVKVELATRYGNASRRAILTSYRDALKRYRSVRKGEEAVHTIPAPPPNERT